MSFKKAKEAGIVICLFYSDHLEKLAENLGILCGVDDTTPEEVAIKASLKNLHKAAELRGQVVRMVTPLRSSEQLYFIR